MKIALGTTSEDKRRIVEQTLASLGVVAELQACAAPSGVSDQPLSLGETQRGAENRARAALAELGGDWGLGLEGGLIDQDGQYYLVTCAVLSSTEAHYTGESALIMLPTTVSDAIRRGGEFGVEIRRYAATHNDDTTSELVSRKLSFASALLAACQQAGLTGSR